MAVLIQPDQVRVTDRYYKYVLVFDFFDFFFFVFLFLLIEVVQLGAEEKYFPTCFPCYVQCLNAAGEDQLPVSVWRGVLPSPGGRSKDDDSD